MGLAAGCRGTREEPFVTYYNAENAITLRYPASWTTEQAQQDGVWYRYFLAPLTGADRRSAVSVTLIAGPLGLPLDQYAQTYLAGNTVLATREESRPGARGRSYSFRSADGKTSHALLLLEEEAAARAALVALVATPASPQPAARPSPASVASPRGPGGGPAVRASTSTTVTAAPPAATPPSAWVYGLYAQGDAASFEKERPVLDEMARSLSLERPATYAEEKNEKFGFSIRIPPSWRAIKTFTGGGTFMKQFTSPTLAAERRQTINASLTLTAEPVEGDVDAFYVATMHKFGDAYVILNHARWRDGYVDLLHSETPVAVSRGKRYFRGADGRGYGLAFEAREDVFPKVSRWCDLIAATLKVGPEVAAR